jgi:hypothetical protein
MNLQILSSSRYKILSGSALKLIACISMLSDHLARHCFFKLDWANAVWFTVMGKPITLLQLMFKFGRFAFPLFAFLLVEGFLNTKNRKKYCLNLFVFALVSEIPFNLMHHTLSYPIQNVMFTLLLGFIAMCSLEYFKDKPIISFLSLVLILMVSWYLRADYRTAGLLFILLLYGLRKEKVIQCVVAPILLKMKAMVFLSLVLTCMYNGKRGFIKAPFLKYFFYAFYPLHMLIIYFFTR